MLFEETYKTGMYVVTEATTEESRVNANNIALSEMDPNASGECLFSRIQFPAVANSWPEKRARLYCIIVC